MTITRRYDDINSFYLEDPRRRDSGETDFGVWWKDDFERNYRVSWVQDTGELYAVALGEVSIARVSSEEAVTFGGPTDTGFVELLATDLPSIGIVEAKLQGWPDVCGTAKSLSWVRSRVQ